MSDTKQVKHELILEDHASGVLHHVGEGFEVVADHAKEAAHEFLSFARDAAAVAVGVNIGNITESMRELVEESFNAARAEEADIRGLAGALSISDRTGASLMELHGAARETKDQLEEMAVAAGADAASVIQGFGEMAERSAHTREELTSLTEEMIYAGRAVSGGFSSIAGGFQSLELGMARASNPVVLLIKQAGLLQGTAKQVAKELTKMAQAGHVDEVVKLGEEAIRRMGEKMRDVQPGVEELSKSFHTLREQVFEQAGGGILEAVLPQLRDLQQYLVENREAIHAFAREAGEKAGEWVTEAAHLFRDGFFYLKDHAAEIRDAVEAAARAIKEAFQFILAHKEEIELALGAKALASLGSGVVGLAKATGPELLAILGKFEGVAGSIAGFGKKAAGPDVVAEMLAGTVGQGGAAAAAEEAASALGPLEVEAAASTGALATFGSAALAALPGIAAIGAAVVAAHAAAEAFREVQEHNALVAAGVADLTLAQQVEIQRATSGMSSLDDEVRKLSSGYGENVAQTDMLNTLWADIAETGDEAQRALVETAIAARQAAGAMSDIAALKAKPGPGYDIGQAYMMQGFQTPDALRGAAPKLTQNVHFSGGQTFQIKQDFRDQDPDRVALIFRGDVLNSATNRLQATTNPYG